MIGFVQVERKAVVQFSWQRCAGHGGDEPPDALRLIRGLQRRAVDVGRRPAKAVGCEEYATFQDEPVSVW